MGFNCMIAAQSATYAKHVLSDRFIYFSFLARTHPCVNRILDISAFKLKSSTRWISNKTLPSISNKSLSSIQYLPKMLALRTQELHA